MKPFAMSGRSRALPTEYKHILCLTAMSVNIKLHNLYVYDMKSRSNSKAAKQTDSAFYEYDDQQI